MSWILLGAVSTTALGRTLAQGGPRPPAVVVKAPRQAPSDSLQVAQEALQRARAYASEDAHAGAIAAYTAAFRLDPSLIATHAHELGLQLTWADRPADAVPWFERRLAADPTDLSARLGLARALSWSDRTAEARAEYERVREEDPGNLDARVGVARMLSWEDRLPEAVRAYEAVLAEHGDVLEARLGRAQCVNWMGQHERATALYREILEDHPEDLEARMGLAQAQRWNGRPQEALRTLEPIADRPGARAIVEELERGRAPVVEAGAHLSHDSDELDILTTRVSWWRDLGDRRSARVELIRRHFEQEGVPTVTGWSAGLGGSHGLGRRFLANAHLWLHRFGGERPAGTLDLDWLLVGYDLWFTWLPSSRLRMDLSSDRSFLDTPRTLEDEISVNSVGLSADGRLRRWAEASALLRASNYSDGNARGLGRLQLALRRGGLLRPTLVGSLTAFRMRERADRGYWSPLEFGNASLTLRIEPPLRQGRLEPMLEGTVGRESDGNGNYGVASVAGRLRLHLDTRWHLELAGGHGDSRLSSDGGYTRSWGSLMLRAAF